MKLGFLLGYSGKHIHIPLDLIRQAESMGFDSVWTAEAYGNDAVTAATWILAGGAHHTGFSLSLTPEYMEDFAEIAGIEYLLIDENTTTSGFKKELLWNQAVY